MTANEKQVAGSHYKNLKMQVWDFIVQNNIPYLEGNIIKYVTRWKDKGGYADLLKARHYLDKLIEIEGLKPKKETENDLSINWYANRIHAAESARHLQAKQMAQGGFGGGGDNLPRTNCVRDVQSQRGLGLPVQRCTDDYQERLKEKAEAMEAWKEHYRKL